VNKQGRTGGCGMVGRTATLGRSADQGKAVEMTSASRLTQLQDKLAARGSRLQINQIEEQDLPPEFDSVGLELRAHRERKGHKIGMAGRVLRIKTAHIQAIEESRFADLPGKTYAIGFVRSYAEYLGLNPSDCIRRFKREYDEALNPKTDDEKGKRGKSGKLAFPEAHEEVRLPHGSIVILASILVLGVWGGWYLTTSAERQFNDAETVALPPENMPTPADANAILRAGAEEPGASTSEVAAGDDGMVPPTSEPDGSATQAEQVVAALTGSELEAPSANEVSGADIEVNELPIAGPRDSQVFGTQSDASRVIIRARGDTWVRVEEREGGVLFEETLQRGDSYRVPNQVDLILTTRNGGAVELVVDGQSVGPAGAVGQPQVAVPLDAERLAAQGTRP